MNSQRARIYYFSSFNACNWLCAFGLFFILFVMFFVLRGPPYIYIFPSIIGVLYIFLCVFAISTACSLPLSSHFYYPEIDETPAVVIQKETPPEQN
eukprot:gene4757-8339_t